MKNKKNLLASIVVNGEPVSPVNQYKARSIKKGGKTITMMYMDKKFTDYKDNFIDVAMTQVNEDLVSSPYEGPVSIIARFYMGTRRRKDLPNMGKLEYDALNNMVYKDDSQIEEIYSRKFLSSETPRVELEIYKYEGHE